jgi:ADP-heptose:LPS heptosyltransferase
VEKTGIIIPTVFVQPSFDELCIVINSCKLFVGALSMPLTIAHACQVPRIIGFSGGNDDFFNIGLR